MATKRSQQKELIDLGPDFYTPAEYVDCLKKLFRVNRLFGFFTSTIKLLTKFSPQARVLDVGCGGGLFLLNLSRHFPAMTMVGVDINADAIHEAQQILSVWQHRNLASQVSFQLQPQPELSQVNGHFDILLITLVCHHLSDEQLITFLQDAYHRCTQVVIINDLQRHRLSLWFYAIFSPVLFRNRLITHDGYISIQRGFTRIEWVHLLQQANIKTYKLKWCFPFRWQLTLLK